jgi:methionyl-tRNA formyltransferase
MIVCIAGKHSIAVNAAIYVKTHHPEWELVILPNLSEPGYDTWQPSLKKWALNANVALMQLEGLYQMEDFVFISLEYDRLIAPDRFRTMSLFNVHFSLLPAYKGAYTSIWPILDGRDHTGVTLHEIDAGIDTGSIIDQVRIPICAEDNSSQVFAKYLKFGYELFTKWISRLVTGDYAASPQPAGGSTFHSRQSLNFTDLRVDLKQTASTIHDQVRAFAFREYQLPDVHGFPICRSEILPNRSKLKPGTLIREDECAICVASVDYDIRLHKDQFSLLLAACGSSTAQAVNNCARRVETLEGRSPKGWTPLIVAAYHGHTEAVECLLDLGVNMNNPNFKGTTPLMFAMTPAAEQDSWDCLRILIANGADINARDIAARTALGYALERQWNEVATFLKANGAKE